MPLPHLDRPFDYLVPAELAEQAVPGTRVRVRFAGQLVDGWLLDRADSPTHDGQLAYLEKVVSPEPVLTPRSPGWPGRSPTGTPAPSPTCCGWPCRPGTPGPKRADPAAAERRPAGAPDRRGAATGPAAGWRDYPAGPAFLRALADGRRAAGGLDRAARRGLGRPGSPRRSPRPSPAAGARSWWSPTPATWTGSTRR